MPYKDPEKRRELSRKRTQRWRIVHPEKARKYDYEREYSASYREKDRERAQRRRAANPEYGREYAQKYRIQYPGKIRASLQKWRIKHPEMVMMRNAVRIMLRTADLPKTSRTRQYIGCTPGFLRNHIEEQFLPGMIWANHGAIWEMDHIVPLSWWDLKNHPENLFEASHWTNLQPLFVKENRTKNARYCELIGV